MGNEIIHQGDVLLYSDENGKEFVNVVFMEETFWLTQIGKDGISRDAAAQKVGAIYDEFRKKQDAAYISEFDREMAKYLKGGEPT